MLWKRILEVYREKYKDDIHTIYVNENTSHVNSLGEVVIDSTKTTSLQVRVLDRVSADSTNPGRERNSISLLAIGEDEALIGLRSSFSLDGILYQVQKKSDKFSVQGSKILTEVIAVQELF